MSIVREVNVMGAAADRMKNSLRSFGKYVPTRLVQELMQSGREAVLGGHKSELTILFCDIAGFTTLSEQMPPEALVDALAEYFAGASDAVAQNGGTVDKFIGDAVMAFWGAPQAIDDAPARACRAAIAIQKKVQEMSERWTAQGRPRFEVRIGINTGEALVGNIGSHSRMNYTAMGDAVNLASRLEGLNKAYGTKILLGESTAARVKDKMLVRALDWVAVKGKAHADLVHELIGESQGDGPEARAAALHWEGLRQYRERQFAAAAETFEKVSAALGGHDEPARVLAERSRHYLDAPPPRDWNGSFAMKEK
jgi:adenylate cyclase